MKGVSIRRVVSRSAFAAAGVALLAAVVAPHVEAQTTGPATGSRPRIFSTTGAAAAVDYVPDQEGGLTPIKDTFHMQFVSGSSSMSSSSGPMARASVADPGNGATQGPAQACPLIVGSMADNGFPGAEQFQPFVDACVNTKWPYTAQADGFTPDNQTDVGLQYGDPQGQLSGDAADARAIINQEDGTSSTTAQMGSMRSAPIPGGGTTGIPLPPALPLPGAAPAAGAPVDTSLLTTGSAQATTANLFDAATAVSHSEATVEGIRLAGGLLTIDSITSIAESRYASGAQPVGTSSTTVQGVQVAGQPATIDDKGVHPEGNPADETLNQLLQSAGLTVRLVGATQSVDEKGFMTAQAQGVVIDYARNVDTGLTLPPPPPNPILSTSPSINGNYFVRYNLAPAEARAFARDLASLAGTTGGTSSGSSSASKPSSAAAPSGFTGGTATAPTPAQGGDAVTGAAVPTVFGLDFDLRSLYLAFTLTALGLCIAPRVVLPARLPR